MVLLPQGTPVFVCTVYIVVLSQVEMNPYSYLWAHLYKLTPISGPSQREWPCCDIVHSHVFTMLISRGSMELTQVLEATLSPDSQTIRLAEEQLQKAAQTNLVCHTCILTHARTHTHTHTHVLTHTL